MPSECCAERKCEATNQAQARERRWASLLLVGLCLLGSASVARSDTVFHFRFDEGPAVAPAGVPNDTGPNDLDATGFGVSYSAAGETPSGTGLSLDASGDFDYVEVSDDPAFLVQEFTLELFAFPNSPYGSGGGSGSHTLFAKKTAESGLFIISFSIEWDPTGQSFSGFIGFGGGVGASVYQSGSVSPGEWHHVALRLDRDVSGTTDQLALFVNGALVAEETGDFGSVLYTGEEGVIGAANYLNSSTGQFRRNFNGRIDEVRLSDEPLTPSHFLAPPPTPPPGGYGNNTGGHDLIIDFSD